MFAGETTAQVTGMKPSNPRPPLCLLPLVILRPAALPLLSQSGGGCGGGGGQDGSLPPPPDPRGDGVHVVAEAAAGMADDAHPVDHGGGVTEAEAAAVKAGGSAAFLRG